MSRTSLNVMNSIVRDIKVIRNKKQIGNRTTRTEPESANSGRLRDPNVHASLRTFLDPYAYSFSPFTLESQERLRLGPICHSFLAPHSLYWVQVSNRILISSVRRHVTVLMVHG